MAEKTFTRGIEKVIWLAAMDREFCRKLFSDRKAAIDESDIELTKSEKVILKNLPEGQLMTVIERTNIPRPARRAFLRGAVASAFALMGTFVTASACTYGIQPDMEAYSESGAVYLREIWHAQDRFRKENSRYAETVKELVENNCLDSEYESGKAYGFTFVFSDVKKDSYVVEAVPDDKNKETTFIDETGIVGTVSQSEGN